jgi:3-deoxy-D-manno-octulosonic-acid transferase
MGELRKFYSLSDVVLVGRSLVPMGGSDPMEVAALGKPIIVGPHTDNFQLPVEVLREAGAIRIIDSADELPSIVGAILGDASLAIDLGSRAREAVIRNQGATKRTATGIARLLETT